MAYFYWTQFRSQLRDRGFLTTASRKSVRDSPIKKGCASLSIHRVPISATMGASPHNLPSFHDFFFLVLHDSSRVCSLLFCHVLKEIFAAAFVVSWRNRVLDRRFLEEFRLRFWIGISGVYFSDLLFGIQVWTLFEICYFQNNLIARLCEFPLYIIGY